MMLKNALHSIVRRTIGEYALYWIYSCRPGPCEAPDTNLSLLNGDNDLLGSPHPEVARLGSYAGPESVGFGVWADGQLAGAAWYWYGDRYRERGFIRLQDGEAKLVQITVAESFRGRGLAPRLIRYSAAQMKLRGFHTLHARIWHSNKPSITAFRRAGWTRTAFIADVHPFGRTSASRFQTRLRSPRAA